MSKVKLPVRSPEPSRRVEAVVSVYDDGKYIRTAIVVSPDGTGGSIDIVTPDGRRLGQINLFHGGEKDNPLMVDVIDIDDLYKPARALTFDTDPKGKGRQCIEGGKLVGVHFTPKGAKE